jgi:hypothetical protein
MKKNSGNEEEIEKMKEKVEEKKEGRNETPKRKELAKC